MEIINGGLTRQVPRVAEHASLRDALANDDRDCSSFRMPLKQVSLHMALELSCLMI
jgi:hypothetical protein